MRKDPTEFRERFKRWKAGERVYDSGQTLPAYDGGKTPEETYYGKHLPDVTIEAPKVNPYVYYDGFGSAATIDSNGRRVLHDARTFNPEGFIPLSSAADYEDARLLLHKTTDPNHAYRFGNMMRNAALFATAAPMAGPLLEAGATVGDAAYAGYKALPWLTQQLIGKGTQAAFAADGLYNFFGPEGTRKTTRLINEGKYGDAALSAAGDILDLSMFSPVFGNMIKNTPKYLHLFKNELSNGANSIKEFYKNSKEAIDDFSYRFGKKIDHGYLQYVLNKVGLKRHRMRSGSVEDHVKNLEDRRRVAQRNAHYLAEGASGIIRVPYRPTSQFVDATNKEIRPTVVSINGQPVTVRTEFANINTGNKYTPDFTVSDQPNGPVFEYGFIGNEVPISIRTNGKDIKIPIKNNQEFTEALDAYVKSLEQRTGARVVGSVRPISKGLFAGVPGDTEVLYPESHVNALKQLLNFEYSRDLKRGTGITGTSPIAFGTERNNLDINVLRDNGLLIHELESTRAPLKMPNIYSQNAKNAAMHPEQLTLSSDLQIPKDSGDGYYTADEYFNAIKDDDKLLTQSVIDNLFKSDQEKHVARAYAMMNNDSPEIAEYVSNALDHIYALIPGFKKFSEASKAQKFDNVEENRKILEKIGFVPLDTEKFIRNPEQMKNIVDYWYMRKWETTRSVNYDPRKSLTFDLAMVPGRSIDNGSTAGGGGNTVSGSKYGGFTRNHTAYVHHHPVTDNMTFKDVYDAFKRELEIWNDHEAVSNAIKDSVKGTKADGFHFRADSWFTDDITRLVNNGTLTHEEGEEIINNVANKLKVSGVRGAQYSTIGDYFGLMQNPKINKSAAVAYRNIDTPTHNDPLLPAEWGSDLMFFNNYKTKNDIFYGKWASDHDGRGWKTGVTVDKSMPIDEIIEKYPNAVTDLRPLTSTKREIKEWVLDHLGDDSMALLDLMEPGDIKYADMDRFYRDKLNVDDYLKKEKALRDSYQARYWNKYLPLYDKYQSNLRKFNRNVDLTAKSLFAGAGIGVGVPIANHAILAASAGRVARYVKREFPEGAKIGNIYEQDVMYNIDPDGKRKYDTKKDEKEVNAYIFNKYIKNLYEGSFKNPKTRAFKKNGYVIPKEDSSFFSFLRYFNANLRNLIRSMVEHEYRKRKKVDIKNK